MYSTELFQTTCGDGGAIGQVVGFVTMLVRRHRPTSAARCVLKSLGTYNDAPGNEVSTGQHNDTTTGMEETIMRSNNNLRTAFLMAAAVTGMTFAAGEARADVANSDPNTSIGTAALKYEHTKALDTSIAYAYKAPSIMGVRVQVGAKIALAPVKNGGPLFAVNMPKGAAVQASWANDKRITLKAVNGTQTDGLVVVRHTVAPNLTLGVSLGSTHIDFAYDATQIIQKLQDLGNANATFNYDSRAQQPFAPWGFAKVDTKLNAPNLDGAELFTLDMSRIELLASNNIAGQFGLRATTKPTFSYTTKKVTLSGADGVISTNGGETSMVAIDGDYLETMVNAEGEMNVAGSLDIQPFVSFTKVFDSNLTVEIPITAYSAPYTVAPTKATFQSVLVHIPLPNVHAPSQGVDLGSVKAGGSATKTFTIENSGEMAASMSFKSSDAAFSVPSGTITVEPKGKYDLVVKFAAANAGPSAADITVVSNDPDSPEQAFKIGANGADVGAPGEGAELPGRSSAGADSGCGCKTAGTSNLPSWAGFGLLGLGAVVLVRRRKNAA